MFDKKSSKPNPEPSSRAPAPESATPAAKPVPPSSRSTAIIGSTVKILGEIISDENLVIEGEVEGTVTVDGHEVTVGPSGRIHASVTAKVVKIDGMVDGDIKGKEKVVISKSGDVRGNILAPRVILEDGGQFRGSIDMGPPGPRSLRYRPPPRTLESPWTTAVSSGVPPGDGRSATGLTMLFAKETGLETLNSRLLPDLFDLEKLGAGQRIRVLDFGPANGQTFNFLNQFNCRLKVIDIRDRFVRLNRELADMEEADTGWVRDRIADALGLDDGEVFDVCFLWDFLNYLDLARLRVLSEVLLPHLIPTTRLHGFAALNRNTPLIEQNYGLVDAELVAVAGQRQVELPYRHSQSAVKDALPGLGVKQSILRADGRLEIIFNRD